jgi:hypothetical protein
VHYLIFVVAALLSFPSEAIGQSMPLLGIVKVKNAHVVIKGSIGKESFLNRLQRSEHKVTALASVIEKEIEHDAMQNILVFCPKAKYQTPEDKVCIMRAVIHPPRLIKTKINNKEREYQIVDLDITFYEK